MAQVHRSKWTADELERIERAAVKRAAAAGLRGSDAKDLGLQVLARIAPRVRTADPVGDAVLEVERLLSEEAVTKPLEVISDDESYEHLRRLAAALAPQLDQLRSPTARPPRERVRVPEGFWEIAPGSGWLLPSRPRRLADGFPLALLVDFVPEHPVLSAFRTAVHTDVEAALRDQTDAAKLEQLWEVALAMSLRFAVCLPRGNRYRTPEAVVEHVRGLLIGAGAPLPRALTASCLRSITGAELDRVTPASRGGGRGRRIQRSVPNVIAALRRELGQSARVEADMHTIRELIHEQPGIGGVEAVRKALKISVIRVRVAIAKLHQEIENRGTEAHPRLHIRE